MKELSLDDCKKILLKILISIDKCCRDNNIKYSLDFGTLLGAVRHNGFIPWDDDIDLMMTRENFIKFKDTYNDDKFDFISPEQENWGWHFIRVCDKSSVVKFDEEVENVPKHGLWVAIFPIDKKPDDEKKWKSQMKKIDLFSLFGRVKRSRWVSSHGLFRNTSKLFMRVLLSPIKMICLSKKVDKYLSAYNSYNASFSFQRGLLYHIFPTSWFDNYIDIEFEGHKFMAISHYDEYLRQEYGDYMKFPPKEKQVPKHEYEAYLLS